MTNTSNREWLSELSENTNLINYLNSIEKQMGACEKRIWTPENPFLTVLIRTQGKRELGLRESLLSLACQSFLDFEIILVIHKANQEGKETVYRVLEDQSDDYRNKIRVFELDEGTRTAPLNLGFQQAKGKYIAVYDDDDILFENWAESFYNLAQEHEGMILHTYAFSQVWRSIDELGYRAETKPKAEYCSDYNTISQFAVNKCPLMTLAFPVNVFQNLGIHFDDSLNVMEDWNYLTRVALICGVADEAVPTAIYRFWKNLECSATLHNEEEWLTEFKKIQEKLMENGSLLNSTDTKMMVDIITGSVTNAESFFENDKATLYYVHDGKFDDNYTIEEYNKVNYPNYEYIFDCTEIDEAVEYIRFNLRKNGLLFVSNISFKITYEDNSVETLGYEDVIHTGVDCYGGMAFIKLRPEIICQVNKSKKLKQVRVELLLEDDLSCKNESKLFDSIVGLQHLFKKRKLYRKGLF